MGARCVLERIWTCLEKRKPPTRFRNSVRPGRSLPRHCADYTNTVTRFSQFYMTSLALAVSLKPSVCVCLRTFQRHFSMWSFEQYKKMLPRENLSHIFKSIRGISTRNNGNKKQHNSLVNVKGGAVSVYATKAYRGSGCVVPVILNLNSR